MPFALPRLPMQPKMPLSSSAWACGHPAPWTATGAGTPSACSTPLSEWRTVAARGQRLAGCAAPSVCLAAPSVRLAAPRSVGTKCAPDSRAPWSRSAPSSAWRCPSGLAACASVLQLQPDPRLYPCLLCLPPDCSEAPLSVVLSPDAMSVYYRMFKLLWAVKHAEQVNTAPTLAVAAGQAFPTQPGAAR